MKVKEHLFTISENHSIREAIISFFVRPSIANPQSYQELMRVDNFLSRHYQKFEPIKQVSIDLSLVPDMQVRRSDNRGFKFISFAEGSTSDVIQGINEPQRTVFTFNTVNYSNWRTFKTNSVKAALSLADMGQRFQLFAYSLMYIDQFYYEDKTFYSPSEVFNQASTALPKDVFESPVLDYTLNTQKRFGEELVGENLTLKVFDKDSRKLIQINNNVSFPLRNSFDFFDFISKDAFLENLERAHQENKGILIDMLNGDVATTIGLIK